MDVTHTKSYLVECRSKHSFYLVIDSLDVLHSGALTHYLLYFLNAFLYLNLHSLCNGKLRLFEALDLFTFGLGLSANLLSQLLLSLFFILFLGVRHRVVHIIYHRIVVIRSLRGLNRSTRRYRGALSRLLFCLLLKLLFEFILNSGIIIVTII